jgi:predicted Zn-dependent protease
MKRLFIAACALVLLTASAPVGAQLGQILQKADQATDALTFTDAEEHQLGADVSAKLREKYGVVQDAAVHKYVTLVGSLLASESSRPTLGWTFIVLDTDGINAFAAPGGFIHITRGALALMQNEAELADALAHEISHVTAKHTLNAIRKNKLVGAGAQLTGNARLQEATNRAYEAVLENAFDRKEETEADALGVTLANKAGYAPAGLADFLTRLADRNKDLKDRSGLFASHPETKARVDALAKVIASKKLAATATVAPRYARSIAFKAVPVGQVAQVAPVAGGAPEPARPADPPAGGLGKFGLGGLNPLGRDKASNQTIASAGSRGVNPDRDARGGPNKSLVVVTVTPAELAAFRGGIAG